MTEALNTSVISIIDQLSHCRKYTKATSADQDEEHEMNSFYIYY